MSVLGDNIRAAREGIGMTRPGLAASMGCEPNTVWRWEKGEREPDIENLHKLAEILKTTVAYLVGETEDPTPSNQTRTGDKHPDVESNVRMGGKFIEIPLLTMATAASCGAGNGLYGVIPESAENIFVEASAFQYLDDTRRPFAVPIEGDSMIGAGLEEGASAVINPADEVMNGDAALVSCDGSWMIKWVVYSPDGSIELRPANDRYEPIIVNNVQIVGRVRGVVRHYR